MTKMPLFSRLLLLMGMMGLSACMTQGTQTAAPTGAAAEVSGSSIGAGSREVTEVTEGSEGTFAENLPGVDGPFVSGGTSGPSGPNGMAQMPSSQGPSSPAPSGGSSDNKLGQAIAMQGGMSSGQVAPSNIVDDDLNAFLKGTRSVCTMPNGGKRVHVTAHCMMKGSDGNFEKSCIFPVETALRIYYKKTAAARGFYYVEAPFLPQTHDQNSPRARGEPIYHNVADLSVVTSDPDALSYYIVTIKPYSQPQDMGKIPDELIDVTPAEVPACYKLEMMIQKAPAP